MSRGALRAQLSLTFDDEQMYDAFIMPYKENKELSPLVIRMLTKYFYNEEVRALIDGCSEDDIQRESESDSKINEMFQNAQQLMACMSALGEIAQDDLQNGVSAMSDIMNATAEATGGTKGTDSQFGVTTPKINQENLRLALGQKEATEQAENAGLSGQDKDTNRLLNTILTNMESMKVNIDRLMKFNGLDSEMSNTEVEKERQIHQTETLITEENKVDSFSDKSDKIDKTIEVPKSIEEESSVSSEIETPLDAVKSTQADNNIASDTNSQPIDGASVLAEFIRNSDW